MWGTNAETQQRGLFPESYVQVEAYLKASLFAKLCISGKVEEAKRAAEGDAETVKQKDAGGRTPLHSFCQYGSSEEVRACEVRSESTRCDEYAFKRH